MEKIKGFDHVSHIWCPRAFIWVLGTKPGLSPRVETAVNHGAISPSPIIVLNGSLLNGSLHGDFFCASYVLVTMSWQSAPVIELPPL